MTEPLRHPNAQATLDHFRHTPPALRGALLAQLSQEFAASMPGLTLARETNGGGKAVVAPDAHAGVAHDLPASDIKLVPLEARDAEWEWLNVHAGQYAGQWVALQGDQLLAHATDFQAVWQTVKALSLADVFYFFCRKPLVKISYGCFDGIPDSLSATVYLPGACPGHFCACALARRGSKRGDRCES